MKQRTAEELGKWLRSYWTGATRKVRRARIKAGKCYMCGQRRHDNGFSCWQCREEERLRDSKVRVTSRA